MKIDIDFDKVNSIFLSELYSIELKDILKESLHKYYGLIETGKGKKTIEKELKKIFSDFNVLE